MRVLGHLADGAGWHDLRLLELDGGVLLQGRPSCVPNALVLASRELTDGDLGKSCAPPTPGDASPGLLRCRLLRHVHSRCILAERAEKRGGAVGRTCNQQGDER
ncbi:MAG: hypothetical protein ACR2JY_12755 [Chloroflexota bacterium]